LFPVQIIHNFILLIEKFLIDEIAIQSQQLRTDVRQPVTAIIAIVFFRHDSSILDHLGNKLMFVLVEAKDRWRGTIVGGWGFDF